MKDLKNGSIIKVTFYRFETFVNISNINQFGRLPKGYCFNAFGSSKKAML